MRSHLSSSTPPFSLFFTFFIQLSFPSPLAPVTCTYPKVLRLCPHFHLLFPRPSVSYALTITFFFFFPPPLPPRPQLLRTHLSVILDSQYYFLCGNVGVSLPPTIDGLWFLRIILPNPFPPPSLIFFFEGCLGPRIG